MGMPSSTGAMPFRFPFEILVQTETLDVLLCLPESQPHASTETDILCARPLLDQIPRHLEHLRVGSPSQKGETMMGGEDVDGISLLDLPQVDPGRDSRVALRIASIP